MESISEMQVMKTADVRKENRGASAGKTPTAYLPYFTFLPLVQCLPMHTAPPAPSTFPVREGFKKSKWKFKMAFAMKGEGVSRGSRGGLEYHIPILKYDFFENHLESFRIIP